MQHTFVEGEENREVISCHSITLAPIAVSPTMYPQAFLLGGTSTPWHSLECELRFPYCEPALAGPQSCLRAPVTMTAKPGAHEQRPGTDDA